MLQAKNLTKTYGEQTALNSLNLTINEGRGSANTVQVVGAGTDTFGLADSSSIINLVSKGGEIKSVMEALQLPRRTLNEKMQRHGLVREDFVGQE